MWAQVGERIRKLRVDRNLSRAQFGRMIGVSGQYVGKIERGMHGLSGDSIAKICNAMNISADYILFGVTDFSKDPVTSAAVNGLSHEQIAVGLDIIKKIAQLINTEDGNEALIREIKSQLHDSAT